MKLVFLDIDGVLNSRQFFMARGPEDKKWSALGDIDPKAAGLVNRLCEFTGAKIVVSSTWRLLHKKLALAEMFRAKGLIADVVGVTPALPNQQRGDEIQLWLDRTAPDRVGDVEGIVILDDDQDMVHLAPWHVKTEFFDGFTHHDMTRAVEILARPWDNGGKLR